MNKKVSYYSSALVILLLIFISSCNVDPKPTTGTDTPTKPFTVTSHLGASPEGLNPITSGTVRSRSVTNQIFSHLVHYDTKTLKASPVLLKKMPEIENLEGGEYPIAMHYEILDEAVWDNGQPVTGHDVEFTLKVMLNPKVPADLLRPFIEKMKHIEIDKDNPKKFTIYSDLYFLLDEIFTNFPILPIYVYDAKGLLKDVTMKELADPVQREKLEKTNSNLQTFADEFDSAKFNRETVVGCGPYKFVEWVTGQRIILRKKENWWGDKFATSNRLLQGYPTEIIFKPIEDMTTAITELKDGAIDVMGTVDSKNFEELKASKPAKKMLNFYSDMEYIYYFIVMNRKKPKLADKKVRRALAHLVNVDEIIDVVQYGYATRTVGPFHPSKPYYHKGLPLIDFNIEKGRALLKEAGWEDTNNNGIVDKIINGKKVELDIEYQVSQTGFSTNTAALMKDDFKKAGVNLNVVSKDANSQREAIMKREYEIAVGGFRQDPSLDDPKQLWHTTSDTPSGSNRGGFGNAESDRLIEEIQVTMDETKRNKLYKKFQEIIYEDQPYIFLFTLNGRTVINKKFDIKPSLRKPGIFENQFRLAKGEVNPN